MSCTNILGLFSSGSGCTPSINTTVASSTSISTLTNILTQYTNTTQATAVNNQTINFENGPGATFVCPNGFDISQSSEQNVVLTQELSATQTQNLVSQLQNYVNSNIQTQMQVLQSSLSTAPPGTTATTVSNALNESIVNNFTTEFVNSMIANSFNNQSLTLTNFGYMSGGTCVIDQYSVMRITASNMMNAYVNTALQDQTISSAVTGISSTLSSASGKAATKSAKGSGAEIAIIVVLGILGLGVLAAIIYGIYYAVKNPDTVKAALQLAAKSSGAP